MSQWAGVVLAAGMGARMNSRLPKVLHLVCGKEMVRYPVDLLRRLGIERIVVVVSPANRAAVEMVLGEGLEFVEQPVPKGTGDAVAQVEKILHLEGKNNPENLLVLGADSPMLEKDTLERLMASHAEHENHVTFLTGHTAFPGDLGRVRRDDAGQVTGIVEAAVDGKGHQGPEEINSGVYCFSASWLWENLPRIQPSAGGEVYLTSLASLGSSAGSRISGLEIGTPQESPGLGSAQLPAQLLGINNRAQLAQAEAAMRRSINHQWMLDGVTITDPESVFIDADVTIGRDTVILPNTMLLGRTIVGDDSEIGPGSVIKDSKVGNRCRVTASMLEEATMEDAANIGPFSHLRPGAYLESGVHVGNFAEVKESRLATGVLMGHFGYIGDASVGANVNLGAGTVTCNYDGQEKHRTNIGAGAFVGCDTMLVAPVNVGEEAITGAGSVITNDVPAGRLAVGVPARIVSGKSDSG